MIKFEVKNRYTNDTQFTAEIDCDENRSFNFKLGLAVRWAFKFKADLKGAYLKGANLKDANLKGADLKGADLRGAIFTDEKSEDVPVIEDIHKKVYAAVTAEGNTLDMSDWHHDSCNTTHCRAGWVTTLAGKEGANLESKIGTAAAAYAIYYKSDPDIDGPINFYASNEDALADIKKMAGMEKE